MENTPKQNTPKPNGGNGANTVNSGNAANRGKGNKKSWGKARGKGNVPAPVQAPPTFNTQQVVERREGVQIVKLSQIDQAKRATVRVQYEVRFDGHEPLAFPYLSAARERAKEPPPELAAEAEKAEGATVESDTHEQATLSEGENPVEATAQLNAS